MQNLAGKVVSTFNVSCYCGATLNSDTPTRSTNKKYFIQRMKKEGWRFRGMPRQWQCQKCIAEMKAKNTTE